MTDSERHPLYACMSESSDRRVQTTAPASPPSSPSCPSQSPPLTRHPLICCLPVRIWISHEWSHTVHARCLASLAWGALGRVLRVSISLCRFPGVRGWTAMAVSSWRQTFEVSSGGLSASPPPLKNSDVPRSPDKNDRLSLGTFHRGQRVGVCVCVCACFLSPEQVESVHTWSPIFKSCYLKEPSLPKGSVFLQRAQPSQAV